MARHRSEAKLRFVKHASRTSTRLQRRSRAQISFELHVCGSNIMCCAIASRAPELRRRQSIRRRRRPPSYRRGCRVPQPWAACAKSAAQKLSPTSTTGLETHANAIVLQAPCGVNCDVRCARVAAVFGAFGGSCYSSGLIAGRRPEARAFDFCLWSLWRQLFQIHAHRRGSPEG